MPLRGGPYRREEAPYRREEAPYRREEAPYRREEAPVLPRGGPGASSRHRGLLKSSQDRIPFGTEGLLSAQGPLSAAQGPPLGGTGASSRS